MRSCSHLVLAFLLVVAGLLTVKADCAVPAHPSNETMSCCAHGSTQCDMGAGNSSCCDHHLQGPSSQASATSALIHFDLDSSVVFAELARGAKLVPDQRDFVSEPAASPPPPLVLRV